ncbi:carbon storage regulator CsrA [Clostridium sp. 'White wine YQ']|uniref:carbon storage regulator CsrA n=1 Tax=Clostridium sp. 'White wine YQ' TaxID=3027474 RepID=UPI0023664F5C|nr:carbon storage regulator CsrA [Clostridium sp. 'White wine YQ']MDD7794630.1 carbon storage regulator CsrA [Clostridium sp. 'White wine YQ']
MLVITRKKGEALLIGDDIEIEVIKLENGNVKLAINAPKSIRILRKELYEEVTNENKEAISFDLDMLKNIKK